MTAAESSPAAAPVGGRSQDEQERRAVLTEHCWQATDAATCGCGWTATNWSQVTLDDDEAAWEAAFQEFVDHQVAALAATPPAAPERATLPADLLALSEAVEAAEDAALESQREADRLRGEVADLHTACQEYQDARDEARGQLERVDRLLIAWTKDPWRAALKPVSDLRAALSLRTLAAERPTT
jgi:hypothetical protein